MPPAEVAQAVAQGARQNALQGMAWDAAQQAARQYKLDPNQFGQTFLSLINQESGWDPSVVNPTSGASGIAQIMPRFHPGVDPFDPSAALPYAADYLAQNIRRYGGDYLRGVAAYNFGPGNVDLIANRTDQAFTAALPQETQQYVSTILGGANPQAATDPQGVTPASFIGDPYAEMLVSQQDALMQQSDPYADPAGADTQPPDVLQLDPSMMDQTLAPYTAQGGGAMPLSGPYGNIGPAALPQQAPDPNAGYLPGSGGTPAAPSAPTTPSGAPSLGLSPQEMTSLGLGLSPQEMTSLGLPPQSGAPQSAPAGFTQDPQTLEFLWNGIPTGTTDPAKAQTWLKTTHPSDYAAFVAATKGVTPGAATGGQPPGTVAANISANARAQYYQGLNAYRDFQARMSLLNSIRMSQTAADAARQNARTALLAAAPNIMGPGQSPYFGGMQPGGPAAAVAAAGGVGFQPMLMGQQGLDVSPQVSPPDPRYVALIQQILGSSALPGGGR